MKFRDDLPLRSIGWSFALTAAFALSACGTKKDETSTNATNNAANSVASSPAAANATEPANTEALENMQEMERHHRQEMDHGDMRDGGMKHGSQPSSDQPSMNQSAPMQDM